MSEHFVYRCFDADGLLLYVGCTSNVKRRMSAHRRDRRSRASHALQVLMSSYTVAGPYSDEATGKAAEAAAIAAEEPLLNIVASGTPGWLNNSRLARYLTERGIAIEACGLHRCPGCDDLRGRHMPHGLCSDCQEFGPDEVRSWRQVPRGFVDFGGTDVFGNPLPEQRTA